MNNKITIKLNISPRKQWENNNGYCGVTIKYQIKYKYHIILLLNLISKILID
jgi:hypothetical protein